MKATRVHTLACESRYLGKLPKGCQLCHKGLKSVIFVTGTCNGNCFYCPIGVNRRGDVIYANERLIAKERMTEEILEEVSISGSQGASLTGGDPLMKDDRSNIIVSRLKDTFGSQFHIHLYTLGRNNYSAFPKLSNHIDEIRFHLRSEKDLIGLKEALKYSWTVGLEVPCLNDTTQNVFTQQGLELLQDRKSAFININELEYSETNYEQMQAQEIEFDDFGRVPNFPAYAEEILQTFHTQFPAIDIHFCTVVQKDSVQLVQRLLRRAKNISYPFDIIIKEGNNAGLLLRGEITSKVIELNVVAETLEKLFDLQKTDDYTIDQQNNRILISPVFLEDSSVRERLKKSLDGQLEIGQVAEYPTWDHLRAIYYPLD